MELKAEEGSLVRVVHPSFRPIVIDTKNNVACFLFGDKIGRVLGISKGYILS